jgi:hypothetical protein
MCGLGRPVGGPYPARGCAANAGRHAGDARRWRPLEDAPPELVAAAVRRVEQRNAPWRLPSGDGEASLLERLDVYVGRIERRARAVRG